MKAIRRILKKVSPWKGQTFHCPGCGRMSIHSGACAYCGTHMV